MKELKKTSGIRFKVSEVEMIKKRESLKTLQEVYDFLMSEYMKLYKVEKPSIFSEVKEKDYDGSSEKKYSNDEAGHWSEPKKEIKIIRSFENYRQLRNDCENEEDWMKLKEEIQNASNLSTKQIVLLTN